MDFAEIIYDKKDRVATVTMNRPAKLNAWTPKMGAEMRTAMLDAERDPSIGAIIVTGAGRAYCAGADMGGLSDVAAGTASARGLGAKAPDEWLDTQRADYRTAYSWPMAFNTPVIGAINGACVGLGFTTCLYHDVRIASDNARMGLIFTQRGLAIEHGSSWMLPRIVGLARAMELALTGRLMDANEALEMGLVSRVVPQDKLMATARDRVGDREQMLPARGRAGEEDDLPASVHRSRHRRARRRRIDGDDDAFAGLQRGRESVFREARAEVHRQVAKRGNARQPDPCGYLSSGCLNLRSG